MRRGRGHGRVSPFAAGMLALIVVVIATWFAYSRENPLGNPYELTAVFENVNELKPRSPVRIAGVDVGKVTEVQPVDDGSGFARVKMRIKDEGRPIKRDAELRIRSRLFLEGNYFIDVAPGSPSEPELEDNSVIPPQQTTSPVQFGQVLNALQRDTREELQTFLREYSEALRGSGARGFNNAIKYWERAYKANALVSRATLGLEEHDLQKVLRGQGKVFGALSEDTEALKDLVTGLNRTMRAFASQEDNLRNAIPALRDVLKVGRPALQSINRAFPSIRAFARDALPGMRSNNATLDAQIPFVKQLRGLVGRGELRTLVPILRDTVPTIAKLNKSQARSFEQSRALAACQNKVLLPFSKEPVPDPDFPENSGQPFYKSSPRAFVGLAGESRMQDANSPFFRVVAGGGPTTLVSTGETGEQYFAQPLFPLDGVRPIMPPKRPVFRPNIPCELQEPPDLNAVGGGPEDTGFTRARVNPVMNAKNRARMAEAKAGLTRAQRHIAREMKGLPSIDPLSYNERGEQRAWRALEKQVGRRLPR